MRTSRFLPVLATVLAVGFATLAPSLLRAAETDDTLRPLIVRPTSNTDTPAAPAPAAAAPSAPAAATSTPTNISAVNIPAPPAATDVKLKLPPPPKPNDVNVSSSIPTKPIMPPQGSDMFANFGPPSGSSISDRVFQLRDEAIALRRTVDGSNDEFAQLRGRGAAGAIQYHSTVAAITARLEAGTTRGNPILMRQWSEAEQSLSEVHYSISKLNVLSSQLSASSSTAAYLLQSVRASFELSGALDEDHGQLAMIRDEVARATIGIDHLRNEINEDIHRQNTYLATERANLQALAIAVDKGELLHNSLANQAVIVGAEPVLASLPNTGIDASGFSSIQDEQQTVMPPPEPAPALPVNKAPLKKGKNVSASRAPSAVAASPLRPEASLGQLLVLIRFNQPQVDYESQLYQTVSSALDQKPDADFTVVAVTPKSGEAGSALEEATRHADSVKNSLVQLGLQPNRITTSNTSSEAAESPEVHIYVR